MRKKQTESFLFLGSIIICIENPQESTIKILELIREFGKVKKCRQYIKHMYINIVKCKLLL